MKIQMGSAAYVFPSIELLRDFIKINKQILYPEALISLYYRYENACFVFDQLDNGKINWNAYTARYVGERLNLVRRFIIFWGDDSDL